MWRIKALLLFLALQVSLIHLFSQDLNKGFFSIEQPELAGKSVACILKESRGFMWFGTSEGLCRFDGTNVKVYKHNSHDSTSLAHSDINAIIEDDQRNLWIGTANGLNLYNREKDNFINVDRLAHYGMLSKHYITTLAFDKEGKIWIGTLGGGVNIFDPKTLRFAYLFSGDSDDHYVSASYINAIVVEDDRAWIASRAGLKILNVGTLTSISYPNENAFKQEVTCASQGQNGNVWLGFSDGEIVEAGFKSDAFRGKTYAHIENNVRGLNEDNQGNLWIITEKSGLACINATNKEISYLTPQEGNYHSAPALSLRTVRTDDQRRVWVGTYNMGVYFIDRRLKKFELYQRNPLQNESLRDNYVRAFAEDKDGTIWIAGNAGVNELSMRTRQISSAHQLNAILGKKVIKDLIVDHQHNLWIGTRDDGVIKVNLTTFQNWRFNLISTGIGNNKILSLYEDSRKTIWAGTLGSGLFYFDNTINNFVQLCEKDKKDHVPDKSFVTSIIEDSDNALWVGTLDGLFVLKRQQGNTFAYKSYRQDDQLGSISSNRIMVLYEDPGKTIWAGTFDNGLNKFIKEGESFENYSEQNGLPNNSIKGIIADSKGNLWISSNYGVSKFNVISRSSKNYTKADGLNSNTFNSNSCLKSKSGHFIFGGDNGFNIFHPDSIRDNLIPPVIYLTDFKINNKSAQIDDQNSPLIRHISLTKEVSLSFEQRSFAVDFVALNYGPPSQTQYCYKLDGFEDGWNYVGSDRTATYTNIDPGRYTFLVKGSNSDGTWSEIPASLEIVIDPPLWKTWWARSIYFVMFISLIYLFLRIRTGQIKIKNQLKLEKLAREKEHELTESKMHFFTNISHELRTPLSLILMPLEKVTTSLEVPVKLKKSLSVAYRNASNLMKLVNELMDLSKFDEVKPKLSVQHKEVVQFIREIVSTFNDISERKNIQFSLIPSAPEICGWFDLAKLEKIIQNILSNAFKFTPNHGQIRIQIKTLEPDEQSLLKLLEITIWDNGIGIAHEELPMIFNKFYQAKSTSSILHSGTGIGLSLTQTLVEVHRGTIQVESNRASGTTFIVTVPIDRMAFSENEIKQTPTDVIDTRDEQLMDYNHIIIDQNIGKPELLVVEDNDELREFLVGEFSLEFSVTDAGNGDEGFRLACEIVPDLIISDIVLPGKTGLELCKEVKSDIRTSHIPVLLLTAKTSSEDQVVGLESGADIYIPKPFSIRVLKAQVRQIIFTRKKLYARYSQDAYLMPASLTENLIDKEFLQKAVDYIDKNLCNSQLSVDSIAELFHMSRSQVYRKIKALTGQTVVEFIRIIRLKHALKLMEEKRYNFSEIADHTGFNSLSYFTRSFKEQYGKAPSEFLMHKD
jgi:signal transduction histidine kinase/ligand-binding sensor domain-containing protein/AraC-like DNA-binding protein